MLMKEEEIREIIRESVRDVLNERKKGLIIEMPYHRGVYKEKVNNLLPQIFINWCLVRYRTITKNSTYIKHWKDELRGHMFTAAKYSIKDNNSEESRMKVLNEILSEEDYDQPRALSLTVCNKFIKEKINVNSNEYEQVIIDCIDSIRVIFDLIVSKDIQKITNYIETI